jgi:hypothetical protein
MDTEAIKSRFNYVNCNLPSNIIFKPKQKRLKIACSVRKEYNCPIVDRVWNILTVRETLRQKRCFQFSYCERSIYAMYVVTFQQHLHMEYISPELVVPIRNSLIEGLLLTRKLLKQGFLLVKLKAILRMLYVAIMTCLTVMENLCHK